MNIFLIRHSEQLRLNGQKNVKDDTQTQNEKIVLSVEGEKKALEMSNLQELKSIDDIFKDTEKQLDELIQRTDKQLKDFLEK